jgi:hypothetical protein
LEEKSAGIKRKKGRPRKFPGHLVRDMRLKKNRSEYRELLSMYGTDRSDSRGLEHPGDSHGLEEGEMNMGEGGSYDHHREESGEEGGGEGNGVVYDWSVDVDGNMDVDDQSLLAAVGVNLNRQQQQHADEAERSGADSGDREVDGEVPSARAFRLGDDL